MTMEAASPSFSRTGWKRFHRHLDRRARWLAPLCAFGLLTPLISGWLAGSSTTAEWLFDLASHWQWLYLNGLVLASGITSLNDRRHALWLLAVPLLWFTASDPAPDAGQEDLAGSQILSVATANVHLGNPDPAPLLRWLAAARPDVVMLNEVSPDYAQKLAALKGYPYRHFTPRHDPFGLAILSRFPLSQSQTIANEDGIGRIDARLDWNGQPVGLTAWHPMPPISKRDHMQRNQQLQALAQAARASGRPAIVAGDLNATPWSNAFGRLDQAGLRRASGLAPTWPAAGRGWFGIPIDHVLVTPQWRVADRAIGPDLGSDHLPVMVRLALRPQQAPSE